MSNLFRLESFVSAAGLHLPWKIECDALTDNDWKCIAWYGETVCSPYYKVMGVPSGGVKLSDAMSSRTEVSSNLVLIVDDVWTTGKSMNEFREKNNIHSNWIGFVAFARSPVPDNVKYFARIGW